MGPIAPSDDMSNIARRLLQTKTLEEGNMSVNPKRNQRAYFERIPLAMINVASYQRELDETRAKKMVSNYDWKLDSPPTVSKQSDGTYNVVLGQHRVRMHELAGDVEIWGRVLEGLTYAEEGETFVDEPKSQVSLKAYDVWRAELEIGREPTVSINRTVELSGFIMGRSDGSKTIKAISSVRAAYKLVGHEGVALILDLIRNYANEKTGRNGNIIGGLAIFLKRYQDHPKFNVDRLEAVIQKTPSVTLIRMASANLEGFSGGEGRKVMLGRAIWVIYNRGLRSGKLPQWSRIADGLDEDDDE